VTIHHTGAKGSCSPKKKRWGKARRTANLDKRTERPSANLGTPGGEGEGETKTNAGEKVFPGQFPKVVGMNRKPEKNTPKGKATVK